MRCFCCCVPGIGAGDAVFVPAFTFAASAEVVALAGAVPVFVDVLSDHLNMDPASLEAAISMVKKQGKLVPQSGDAGGFVRPARRLSQPCSHPQGRGLKLLCDTAQGFGGVMDGKRAGAIGDAAATSFFPAKPLAAYGDGRACLHQ